MWHIQVKPLKCSSYRCFIKITGQNMISFLQYYGNYQSIYKKQVLRSNIKIFLESCNKNSFQELQIVDRQKYILMSLDKTYINLTISDGSVFTYIVGTKKHLHNNNGTWEICIKINFSHNQQFVLKIYWIRNFLYYVFKGNQDILLP